MGFFLNYICRKVLGLEVLNVVDFWFVKSEVMVVFVYIVVISLVLKIYLDSIVFYGCRVFFKSLKI